MSRTRFHVNYKFSLKMMNFSIKMTCFHHVLDMLQDVHTDASYDVPNMVLRSPKQGQNPVGRSSEGILHYHSSLDVCNRNDEFWMTYFTKNDEILSCFWWKLHGFDIKLRYILMLQGNLQEATCFYKTYDFEHRNTIFSEF